MVITPMISDNNWPINISIEPWFWMTWIQIQPSSTSANPQALFTYLTIFPFDTTSLRLESAGVLSCNFPPWGSTWEPCDSCVRGIFSFSDGRLVESGSAFRLRSNPALAILITGLLSSSSHLKCSPEFLGPSGFGALILRRGKLPSTKEDGTGLPLCLSLFSSIFGVEGLDDLPDFCWTITIFTAVILFNFNVICLTLFRLLNTKLRLTGFLTYQSAKTTQNKKICKQL